MIKNIALLTLLVLPLGINAQVDKSHIQEVSATIQNYFDGYVERDIDKLNAAFDVVNGVMKTPSKTDNGTERFENDYFKDIIPRWATREKLSVEERANCVLEILNIQVTDSQMAVATIKMKIGDSTYIDVLSLQRLNSNWKITNKMFVVE